MCLFSINIVFLILAAYCDAVAFDRVVKNYFNDADISVFQDIWQKYRKGYETSLEQILQDNYNAKGMNTFKRRENDIFKLTEGFLEVADPAVEVLFRDLYLLELPRMLSPRVSFTLASNLLKVDTELSAIKVHAKYMVYRNQSAISYASGQDMMNVSPFSLQQVNPTGEVTIIAEECRLSGHAIATLKDQSVNLGHNTFSLTDCKFYLEIWTPGQGSPPVFTRYFHDCDRNYLQNLISKPLQDELMCKLQTGIFNFVNTTEVFGQRLPKLRKRQTEYLKTLNQRMEDVVNNLNVLTTKKNQGVVNIDPKIIVWKEVENQETSDQSVFLSDLTIYGLDTAYSAHTGGPIQLNGAMYFEETIGFNMLQVKGKIDCEFPTAISGLQKAPSKFSAELHDLTVVVRLQVENGAEAANLGSNDKSKRSWFTPQIRNFELNLYEISRVWARSLVTAYITNEIYTSVMMSLLYGQLNEALKLTDAGQKVNIDADGVVKALNENKKIDNYDDIGENNVDKPIYENDYAAGGANEPNYGMALPNEEN